MKTSNDQVSDQKSNDLHTQIVTAWLVVSETLFLHVVNISTAGVAASSSSFSPWASSGDDELYKVIDLCMYNCFKVPPCST